MILHRWKILSILGARILLELFPFQALILSCVPENQPTPLHDCQAKLCNAMKSRDEREKGEFQQMMGK